MKRLTAALAAMCIMLTGCFGGEATESSKPTELVVSGTPSDTSEQEKPLFPLEICGTEIKTEAKKAVSLSPAVTEIIAELGLTDRLCGVSDYCDYPENLDKETVGSAENPDMEKLLSLKADVIFTLSGLAERDIYALSEVGTAVVCLEAPTSVDGYKKLYADIAAAFMGADKAAEKAEAALKALSDKADGAFSGSYIYVTPKLTAAGADTFESAVLSLSGGNLCKETGYTELLSLGEIKPDYVIAADSVSYDTICADEVLSVYVYNGSKVLYVSTAGFERPSARTGDIFGSIKEQLEN